MSEKERPHDEATYHRHNFEIEQLKNDFSEFKDIIRELRTIPVILENITKRLDAIDRWREEVTRNLVESRVERAVTTAKIGIGAVILSTAFTLILRKFI